MIKKRLAPQRPASEQQQQQPLQNDSPITSQPALGDGMLPPLPGAAAVHGMVYSTPPTTMDAPFADVTDPAGPGMSARGFMNPLADEMDEESEGPMGGMLAASTFLSFATDGDGEEGEEGGAGAANMKYRAAKALNNLTETEISPAQIAVLGTAATNVEGMLGDAQDAVGEAFTGATTAMSTMLTNATDTLGGAVDTFATNVESVTQDLQGLDVDQLGEVAGAATAYASVMQDTLCRFVCPSTMESDRGTMSFKCPLCDMPIESQEKLKQHIKVTHSHYYYDTYLFPPEMLFPGASSSATAQVEGVISNEPLSTPDVTIEPVEEECCTCCAFEESGGDCGFCDCEDDGHGECDDCLVM